MGRIFVKSLACALLLAWSLAGRTAGPPGGAEPPFRFYTVVDGLTQSEVIDIQQDQAGYLWFTTARGLNRYDGEHFEHFTIADGLPSNSLTALHIDADNSVWVGDGKSGLSLVKASRIVRSYHLFEDVNAPIVEIETYRQRMFVVVEALGIFEVTGLDGDPAAKLIPGTNVGATDIAISGTRAWAVGDTGLYEFTFDGATGIRLVDDSIRQVHVDADGRLWAADVGNRIGHYEDGSFTVLAEIDPEQAVVGLSVDGNGHGWLTTPSALFAIDLTTADAAPTIRKFGGLDEVSSLFIDREDSVWLSSESRLIRFLGDRFRHYRLGSGPEPRTVWGIAGDQDGSIWFGTQSGMLKLDADGKLARFGDREGVPAGTVRDVVADHQGDFWFSVADRGLFRFDTGNGTAEQIDATASREILDIDLDTSGAVWFSTMSSGVFRYTPSDDSLTAIPVPAQAPVYSLDAWDDGSVWYGVDEVGLVRLETDAQGEFRQTLLGVEDGLAERLFDHIRVTADDEVWVATDEGGLYRMSGGRLEHFGKGTPLADQTVYLVEPLDDGTVVVGGEQGLYQFEPGAETFAHYNQRRGFIGLETNVHATYFDRDGGLWIGTVDGATRMDVSRPMQQFVAPVPSITRFESERNRQPVADGESLDPDGLGLQIEFASVSLLDPKGIEYSYRLSGADSDWGPATPARSVSYPRLPPGKYEFMVRARARGAPWTGAHAGHGFTVLPFFWQKPLFQASLLVVFLVLLRTAMVYRTRNIQKTNESLMEQVEERTRSIRKAKEKLEESNQQLSREIEERRKADHARAELETRFRLAFENAPIGMGLLDRHGVLFDANPALREMFCANGRRISEIPFDSLIADDDREKFMTEFDNLAKSRICTIDRRFACRDTAGNPLNAVVNVSPVHADSGEFLYSVVQVLDVTESMKLTQRLEYQASYDELTGLLNRRAFAEEMARAWERSSAGKNPSYLLFMDLDQFKVVNDTSGHVAGDQLLRGISELLQDSVRANDVVARLGGDEFGIILWECPTEVAERIAESIRSSVENYRFLWDEECYRVGISIGGMPIDPAKGDISDIQQLADSACYAAKEAGRNRVHMIHGEQDTAVENRGQVRWIQRLREAMDNNRFAIYGQAMKPLNEGSDTTECIEVLLRLRDPESRRLIPPGAFLPAVERYGLSVELDQWVVSRLMNALFVHQAFQAEPRQYWINLSGTSIGDSRFAEFLIRSIDRSPLPPGTINFEITETAVIRNINEAGRLMSELKEMGCRFSLDDFGSGLASFRYLRKLPVDFVKIDGVFIRDILDDPTNRIFVQSIIDIARSLDIRTIAQFIENDALLDLVRTMGADFAQGFSIARPFELAPRFPDLLDGQDPQSAYHAMTG